MHDRIRLAVVDDHEMVRDVVMRTISGEDDFEIVGEGASAAEALAIAQNVLPDIMLIDVSMPGGGINAVKAITQSCPIVKLVMLTVADDEKTINEAMVAGASGYLLKGVSATDLIRKLRKVYNGQSYLTPSLANRILSAERAADDQAKGLLPQLHHREDAILRLVADGISRREIAECLDVDEQTVKRTMANIQEKLQVRYRVWAALRSEPEATAVGEPVERH